MPAVPPEIFKANDIRGVAGETLTVGGARLIGRALAAEAREQGAEQIALGRDGRLSGPEIAAALAEGLRLGGMRAVDVGVVPTPALYYAAATRCGGSGVMVTGSHNPKNHNGMKMMLAGQTLKREKVRALFERIESENFGDNAPATKAQQVNIAREYIDAVIKATPQNANAQTQKQLKIVVDAGNGAAGEIAPLLYQKMGCEVRGLFCDIDGNFPNHHPDPARAENIVDAKNAADEWQADAAFVFDGDGDRLGVLLPGDNGAENIFPDRLLMLFARDMLTRNKGSGVVYDVKCSATFAPFVRACGGKPDMQPTGHAFIKARMKETGALLGGEMSGHFYFAENWFGVDDALLAGARLIRILESGGGMKGVPQTVASPELLADMSGRDQHAFIARLQKSAKFPGAKEVVDIDGLRVEYEDGFGLARASNTTPSLVFRFEGADAAALQRIQDEFRAALQDADANIKLPF